MNYLYVKKYKLESHPIFRGVCGEIYYGYNLNDNMKIAIKKIFNIDYAKDEAQAMSAYGQCKSFPQFYDFIITKRYAYIIMELCKGKSLYEYIKEKHKINHKKALKIFLKILEALNDLHTTGYLHADIQPANILIADKRTYGIKIVDFGSAVKKNADGCWTGKPHGGTWMYMPPEQFKKETTLDESSDIYSAAAVFVFMLTGKSPFRTNQITGNNVAFRLSCYRAHLEKLKYRSRHKILNKIITKALAPERKNRYQTVNELINDLKIYAWHEKSHQVHSR